MVVFPEGFVQLDRYPGYYWSADDCKLYSCKVHGVLRPLKLHRRFINHKTGVDVPEGYHISVKGRRMSLSVAAIMAIVKTRKMGTQIFPKVDDEDTVS